jgi:hypothetical protein
MEGHQIRAGRGGRTASGRRAGGRERRQGLPVVVEEGECGTRGGEGGGGGSLRWQQRVGACEGEKRVGAGRGVVYIP